MKLLITFDFDRHLVYIPDGHIRSISELKGMFLDWVVDQPKCSVNGYGCFFDHNTFLQYLNDVVLGEVNEKAYILDGTHRDKDTPVMHF